MTRETVVAKALTALDKGTYYDLNEGVVGKGCSCSRFVAWAFGVPVKVDLPLYRRWNGGWFESTAVYRDAQSDFGFFTELKWEAAQPGDVLVWPDSAGKQGHMGIVVKAAAGTGPIEVIHCSRGNWKATGDAIRVTGVEMFAKNKAIVAAWCDFEQEDMA